MTLREFLDQVRFGNVSRLCIATSGKEDFLQNYEEGRYWELPSGNWENGSRSTIEPEFPDEMMSAQVIEIDASPNLRDIYANLGRLGNQSRDTSVILVRAPGTFDEDAYWAEQDTWEPTVSMDMHEWAYNISKKKWTEISKLESRWPVLQMAVYNLLDIGLDTIKEFTDEDFENMDDDDAIILRLAHEIALKIDNDKEALAVFELAGVGSAFTKRLK